MLAGSFDAPGGNRDIERREQHIILGGLASRDGVDVEGMEAAAVSYPRFEADLAMLLGG